MPKKKEGKTTRGYAKRKWLNSLAHGGSGTIIVEVSAMKKDSESVNATIDISDCSRTIYLDFSCMYGNTTVNERAALRKLDILMMTLGEFRGKLQDAIDAARHNRAIAPKKRKK